MMARMQQGSTGAAIVARFVYHYDSGITNSADAPRTKRANADRRVGLTPEDRLCSMGGTSETGS